MAKAKASAPDSPPAKASAPAPKTTQQQAGAGETQDQPTLSGANGPDPVIGLRITAKTEGFRRAGRAWSKQPTDVPLADLGDDQVDLLREEHGRMLTVEEVVIEAAAE